LGRDTVKNYWKERKKRIIRVVGGGGCGRCGIVFYLCSQDCSGIFCERKKTMPKEVGKKIKLLICCCFI
jgi:hypothetical protein